METKQNKNKYPVYIILILIFGILLFAGLSIYYKMLYLQQKEYSSLLCQASNKQSDLIKTLYPDWTTYQCNTLKGVLNANQSDYLCKAFKDLKLPDKLDCRDLLK